MTAPQTPSAPRPSRGLGWLLGAGAVAMGLTVAAKGLAFGRDVALSAVFGADSATDAFFIANMVPGILWAAFLSTINVVVLPLYLARLQEGRASAGGFASEAIQAYAFASVLLGLVCALAAGPIVAFTAPDASPATLELARQLTVVMAFGFAFSGYVAIQNALQQAHGLYVSPLAVPVVNNAIAIAGIFAAAAVGDIRIAVLAAVLAWVVQAPLQRMQTRGFYDTQVRVTIRRDTLGRLALLSAPVMLGTFLDQVNIFVGINLAGGVGVGAVSQLNYASRLAVFLATTFSLLVAYFVFPRLSASATRGDDAGAARILAVGVLGVTALTLPLTVVAYILRDDVVGLVYGHGALTAADVEGTAATFAAYALGIVFVAAREIFNRLFFSYHRMSIPLILGVVASVINFAVSKALVGSLGTVGIALGASAGGLAYFVGQVVVVLFWKRSLISRDMLVGLAVVIVAAVPGALALTQAAPSLVPLVPFVRLVAGVIIVGAPFAVVVGLAAWRMGWLRRDALLKRP